MKLWDSLTTCLVLLSSVRAAEGPLEPLEPPPLQARRAAASPGRSRSGADTAAWEESVAGTGQYTMQVPLPSRLEDVVDFIKVTISRLRRSSSSITSSSPSDDSSGRSRRRRQRKKGASRQSGEGGGDGGGKRELERKVRAGGASGRGRGCVLKQIHLNVSDLGLGYRSGEEMIFRYCSGPCRKSETNYDKILSSLAHSRRFPPRDAPPQACCRPIAFDDDLSFLDDNLVYHTVRKHSARKCGCV